MVDRQRCVCVSGRALIHLDDQVICSIVGAVWLAVQLLATMLHWSLDEKRLPTIVRELVAALSLV